MGGWGASGTEGAAGGCGRMLQCSREGPSGTDSAVGVSANFLVLHPSCLVKVQPRDSLLPLPAAKGAGVSGGCK